MAEEKPEEQLNEQPQEEAPEAEQPEVEPSQPTEEEEPEAPVEETEPEPESPEETPAEEEPKEPSRRETLRIQQLLAKMKDQPKPAVSPEGGLDYKTALDADPEVVAQLEADRKAVAEAQYQRGFDQAKSIQFHTRLEIDAPKVETKYPQLNKDSDQFDPVVADEINSLYLHLVGYDSKTDTVQNNLRYADFVETQFGLAERLAKEKVAKTSLNIAKQAANTGLRPDGSSAKRLNLDKAPEEMTDEELDAVLAKLPKSR